MTSRKKWSSRDDLSGLWVEFKGKDALKPARGKVALEVMTGNDTLLLQLVEGVKNTRFLKTVKPRLKIHILRLERSYL